MSSFHEKEKAGVPARPPQQLRGPGSSDDIDSDHGGAGGWHGGGGRGRGGGGGERGRGDANRSPLAPSSSSDTYSSAAPTSAPMSMPGSEGEGDGGMHHHWSTYTDDHSSHDGYSTHTDDAEGGYSYQFREEFSHTETFVSWVGVSYTPICG